jgi:hypothetical protein
MNIEKRVVKLEQLAGARKANNPDSCKAAFQDALSKISLDDRRALLALTRAVMAGTAPKDDLIALYGALGLQEFLTHDQE